MKSTVSPDQDDASALEPCCVGRGGQLSGEEI